MTNGNPPLIVVLDDQISICYSIERLVRSYGFACRSFTSTAEFWAGDFLSQVACFILDYRMPQENGLQFLRRLRALGDDSSVLLITGFLTDELRQEAFAAGANAVLEKPLDQDVLISNLQTAMLGNHV